MTILIKPAIFKQFEKTVIILLFLLLLFAVIYHPDDPVFMGEFNNRDGSIYAARSVDVIISLIIFFTVVFGIIPAQLLKNRYLLFILSSLLLLSVISAVEYGLDQVILHLFNLPTAPGEISDKLLNNPRRDIYYSTIVPGNIMIYGLALLYGISRDWIAKSRRQNQLQKEKMQADIDFLRSQVNPHFFFNSLNNIYAITRKNRDRETGEAIMKLSAVMRYMIYDSEVDLIVLDKEVEHIRQYLDLVRLKFSPQDQIDLHFSIKEQGKNIRLHLLYYFPLWKTAVNMD